MLGSFSGYLAQAATHNSHQNLHHWEVDRVYKIEIKVVIDVIREIGKEDLK